jgi:hypothetical protein
MFYIIPNTRHLQVTLKRMFCVWFKQLPLLFKLN